MTKRSFIVILLTVVMLAVVLTFEITFVTLEKRHQKELDEFANSTREQLALFYESVGAVDENGQLITLPENIGDIASKYSKLAQVDNTFRSLYIGEMDEEALLDGIMLGYIYGSGDKYAHYFSKEEFAEVIADTKGDLVGIGVLVINTDGFIEIINVMPDSPALEAGVQPGDIIIKVGDENVSEIGYQLGVNRMLGEEGTDAVFTVLRDGEELEFSITRAHVNEQSVMSRFYEPDPTVGVVKVISFDEKTPEQFKNACQALIDGGAQSLVFDVRYNPGGELNSIVEVLDYLLPEGPIVRIVSSTGEEETYTSKAGELDIPMCVLVNGSTASAAELFSSALQDHEKAVIVGTTTYGKGTVQGVFTLPDGSGFTVSHSMYYPPFSDCYEGIGVIPDVECEMDESLANKNIYKITDEEDNQLNKAVEILGGKVPSAPADEDEAEDTAA